VHWDVNGAAIRLSQETQFPGTDECTLSVEADHPAECAVNFRVPLWCGHAEVKVNDEKVSGTPTSGQWFTLRRSWSKDKITVRFPMEPRPVSVDRQHPNRMAVKYGPLLMVQDARYTFPIHGDQSAIVPNLTKVSNLPELRFGTVGNSSYNPNAVLADINMANGERVGRFIPLWSVPERNPYRTYFDMDRKTFF
jgi:hypothetical protein